MLPFLSVADVQKFTARRGYMVSASQADRSSPSHQSNLQSEMDITGFYLLRSATGLGEFAPQFAPRRSVFVGLRTEF